MILQHSVPSRAVAVSLSPVFEGKLNRFTSMCLNGVREEMRLERLLVRYLNITYSAKLPGNAVPFTSGHAPLTSLVVTSAAYLSRSLMRCSQKCWLK